MAVWAAPAGPIRTSAKPFKTAGRGGAILRAMRRFTLAAAFSATLAAALSAAPVTDPLSVFRGARDASGGAAWDHSAALAISGTLRARGLRARWRALVDVGTGAFRVTETFPSFRIERVWNGRDYWQRGRSGGVHRLDSRFAREAHITDGWIARRGYLRPDGLGAALADDAERKDGGEDRDVVTATPAGGRPVRLWFDAATHRLARADEETPTGTRTLRYSDYRWISGLALPFRIVTEEGPAENAEIVEVEHVARERSRPGAFREPEAPHDFSVAGGRTVVPIVFEGLIGIDATIDGKGPFLFILDTGGRAILTPETARRLRLATFGAVAATGAGAGSLPARFTTVGRLRIGGATLRRVSFAVIPLSYDTIERGPGPSFAGILGLELFERFAIRIDYGALRATLEPLETFHHAGEGVAVPITFDDDMPIVPAIVGGREADVALDTGNPMAIAVSGKWAARVGLGDRLKNGLPILAGGAVGGEIALSASRTDVAVAGTSFPRVVGYYAGEGSGTLSSASIAGIVGNEILAHFSVTFDYRRGEAWFADGRAAAAPAFDRAGLMVEKERPEAFRVLSVIPGSPAAEAGIAPGDEILSVDGRSASELSGWDFSRLARRPAGTTTTFAVRSRERERSVALVLREILF